jgi:hypothetical protein
MFVSEIRNLVDSLLFQIERLEQAQAEWLAESAAAARHATATDGEFPHALFSEALNGAMRAQGATFALFESLLAAWARLSLLIHPIEGKGEMASWRAERGRILRGALNLGEQTLLANRSFRDSWMHFDERLDQAFLDGWLGNLQQFVRSAQVTVAVQNSVRVIDVESLTFHYRTRNGAQESVSIADVKACVLDVERGLQGVGPRITALLERP